MTSVKTDKVGVYLADGHTLLRQGSALMLEKAPDMEVVGEAGDGWQAVDEVKTAHPEIVLMDVDLPGLSGIDAIEQIAEFSPQTSVILLTLHDREDLLARSLEAGARGYVLKTGSMDEVVTAIQTVYNGEAHIYPSMATKLVDGYVKRVKGRGGTDPYDSLSSREREVLPMLAEGRSIHEIGDALHLSPYTVQTYRQRVMHKLGVHSATELLMYALRRGLIHLEP